MFFSLFLSLFFLDCIDIICAFSTLALVFKATEKEKEKKRRSLLGYRLKQGEQVWGQKNFKKI